MVVVVVVVAAAVVLAKLFTLYFRQLPKTSFCIITQFLHCFLCFLPNAM